MQDIESQYRVPNILIGSIFINYQEIQILAPENHYRSVADQTRPVVRPLEVPISILVPVTEKLMNNIILRDKLCVFR